MKTIEPNILLYVINADWYFNLHWLDRALAAKSRGYQIHVMCYFSGESIRADLEKRDFICHHLNISRSSIDLVNELSTLLELKGRVKAIRPTLIHSVTVKPNVYAGIVARWLRIPIVCSVTGLGVIFSNSSFRNKMLRSVVKQAYKFCSAPQTVKFLFENAADLKLLTESRVIEKKKTMQVSGAGVDIDEYHFVAESRHDEVSVLFAARLLEDKGLRNLIDAVEHVRGKGIKVLLNVAGIFDEDAQNAISHEQIEMWGNSGVINWLGTRDDMPSLISSSSIVSLPTSYGEGIPRVLIESSACGRAIVTTNVSGCNEFVEDGCNGLIVEPHDTLMLANALEKLIENYDLRADMGRKGRTLVEKKYTKEIVIRQTFEVYRELLEMVDV